LTNHEITYDTVMKVTSAPVLKGQGWPPSFSCSPASLDARTYCQEFDDAF